VENYLFLYFSDYTSSDIFFSGIETYVTHFSSKINNHLMRNKVRFANKHDYVKAARPAIYKSSL